MEYNILYVDDEIANLSSLRAYLRREYKMYTAASGAEALEVLANHAIDLIISDQRMPQMTGVELLEQVRQNYPDIIRMILTGYSDMQAVIDAINRGQIYYYITKPWKGDEIKLIINNALEAYDLRKKNRVLEKENVLAQFEILKNQISPHFLFNCMNILSSLIRSKPDEAELFANKFAKLYRSVLSLREQLLITLKEELDFVENYLDLQRIRFRDKLQVEIYIAENARQNCLPPFALQTLLENAFKHNIISDDLPFLIQIKAEESMISVTNPLQKRKNVTDSTGTGLTNLHSRYKLITNENIVIKETADVFRVELPLIASS